MFDSHYYLVPGKMDCSKTVSGDLGNGNFYILKKEERKKRKVQTIE